MNKYKLLMFAVIVIGIALVVSCNPGTVPTPQVVYITEIVEGQPVEVTRIVEVERPQEIDQETEEPLPNVLRIGANFAVPGNIDPHRTVGGWIGEMENIYEPLAYPYRDTLDIRPVLAEKWEVSEDGRIFEFTLRENVLFHDGSTLNSQVVKMSFERMMGLQEGLGQLELNQKVVDILTPDDRTVVFEVNPGGTPFLSLQTGVLIASGQAIEENQTADDPWATEWFIENAAGTGPYMLAELNPRDSVRMVRFDDYWQGWEGEHVNEILWLDIPEETTQALMLERGELDIASLVPIETADRMAESPNIEVIRQRGTAVFYLRMNVHGGPLSDPLLRKAFAHAFDYETYNAARPNWLPPDGPVPGQFLGDWRPDNLPEYDIELARQYYTEAGYGPDNPLVIDQFIVAGSPEQQTAAEIMQRGLAELGVEYSITPGEFGPVYAGLLRFVREGDQSGYRDMFTLRMPAIYPSTLAYFGPYYSGNDLNMMGYSNPEVDMLIDQASLVPSESEEFITLLREAATKIVEDQPDIWLGVQRYETVTRNYVKGSYMHPLWYPAIHAYPIYFER